MRRTGAILLGLVLGSCGGSTSTSTSPQHCIDACTNVYGTCGRSVDLGTGALDQSGCVANCAAAAAQSAQNQWNCAQTAKCPDLDACLIPLACPGASSLIGTCVGIDAGNAALLSCTGMPLSFRPCLGCIETTACAGMATACASTCPFGGAGGSGGTGGSMGTGGTGG